MRKLGRFSRLEIEYSLGSTIGGVPDEAVLIVRPLSVNLDVQGGIEWHEN